MTKEITTKAEAIEIVKQAYKDGADYVAVFVDGRDLPANFCIMKDGNGNNPLAWITRELWKELEADGLLDEDSYGGFHRRHIFDFKKEKLAQDAPEGGK